MAAPGQEETVESGATYLTDAISALLEGLESLLGELRQSAELRKTQAFSDLEGTHSFLQALGLVSDTMPPERLHEALRKAAKSIQKSFDSFPRSAVTTITDMRVDKVSGRLDFLCHVIRLLGPEIRLAGDEMAAWIRIDPEEGAGHLFTPSSIVANLRARGIVFGINEKKIREILESSTFGVEVCVAEGKRPVAGRNGRIEYKIDIEDLSRAPKILADGKASFKDIKLFTYIEAGDTLAVKIPASPGIPGSTVTGRTIAPLETKEAEFPKCDNARISPDGTRLIATIDGCVTKRRDRIVLEPCLRIVKDVSYSTGNIDSKVTVLVGGGVLSGFSVRSERDIHIESVVEGARLECKGTITVKGGIEGKGKAVVEANGDITAKFIANATVTSLQNILVESGIIQSKVWAGGRVTVSGRTAEIVGGEIEADEDVVADIIGSDMGVKTVVRLGGRLKDLARLLEEVQEKIGQQEEAVDQCEMILDTLRSRATAAKDLSPDMREARERTERMMAAARENLEKLYAEQADLEPQYEECLRRSRTVRARKRIMPGTHIQIQEAEFVFKDPTGPATVVRYGDELKVFPFRELDAGTMRPRRTEGEKAIQK